MHIVESLKSEIKSLTSKNGRISPHWKKQISPELTGFLRKNDISIIQLKYLIDNNLEEIPTCKTCGVRLPKFEHGIKFCSGKCSMQDETIKEKIRTTNIKKYGCENPFQAESVKEKAKQTNLERYGVENTFQVDKYKEKTKETKLEKYGSETYNNREQAKETCLEKYGVEYTSQVEENKEKAKQTNLERYGVEHPFQAESVKEKAKLTNLKKYGCENPFQAEEVKEKIKSVHLSNLGVEYPSKAESVKEKAKQTNLERYGVEHPAQSKEIQEKAKQTNLERYGVENTFQVENYKDKLKTTKLERYGSETYNNREQAKETCLEKYGVEAPLRLKEIQEKAKQTNLERYGVEHPAQSKEVILKTLQRHRMNYKDTLIQKLEQKNIELLTGINEYISGEKILLFKCTDCGYIFESENSNPQKICCPECYKTYSGSSVGEKEILKFIQTILPEYEIIENDRIVLSGKELDIYIPEKNLAIEFDGLYWHSSLFKSRMFHKEKTDLCADKGIQLLHFTDFEWNNKQDIVKALIKSKVGIYEKVIHGRKCTVEQIDSTFYRSFLNENHIQGEINSAFKYGLFYNSGCVAVMGFGTSRFKNTEIELQRFCTKLGYSVHGALSKLISAFIKETNAHEFYSFVDKRYFNGSGYIKSGFNFEYETDPSYVYIVKGFPENRMKYQKHKLKDLLPIFDESLSEQENMINNKFFRLYDCGTKKFKFTKEI